MHDVVHTNVNMPSVSLIKNICYPTAYRFKSKATTWGCEHEKVALELYTEHMNTHHINAKITQSGLFISTDYPFIGATPDALVSCECCPGKGCVEIKCPYCTRDSTVEVASGNPKFCVQSGFLTVTHPILTQIQTQMNVAQIDYCDFFLWLENDNFLQRIPRNCEVWRDYV